MRNQLHHLRKNVQYPLGLFAILCFVLIACNALAASAESVHEVADIRMQPPLQITLTGAEHDQAQLELGWALLDDIYTAQEGRLLWHVNGQLNQKGRELLNRITAIGEEGLSPADYHLASLESFPQSTTGRQLQLREALLTDALFRLQKHLKRGRFEPHEYDPQWFIPTEPVEQTELLRDILDQDGLSDLIDQFNPDANSYHHLKKALARYREIKHTQGGWPEIQVNITLRPGMRNPAIGLLRQRLQIESGTIPENTGDLDYFDESLKLAVMDFQQRHGLVADGLVGPLTRKALNIPVETRIAQIQANMERWRWLPEDLGEQHLLVNAAGYDLALMIDGQPVRHLRTIIGTSKRQTPSFRSNITHLVLNPEWTVPRIIAVEDLLPRQQEDATFLQQREIQVYQRDEREWHELDPHSVDWQQYNKDNFPFILRQKPGVKNSLGRIKFHMASPYAVFLHDTPVRSLFKRPIRTFSSGCVRVEGADQLARQLLLNGGQSVAEALHQPLQQSETQIVKLAKPMQVYLVYFTTWVDQQGRLHFRPDIYKRNRILLKALTNEPIDPPPPHQAVAELL